MPMNSAHASDNSPSGTALASWYTPGRSDGFGDRLLMFDNTDAISLELLRFRPENGKLFRARGRLSTYEARGEYQLIRFADVEGTTTTVNTARAALGVKF